MHVFINLLSHPLVYSCIESSQTLVSGNFRVPAAFINSFVMVALWNRADYYIFILSFVLLSFFLA